MVLEHGRLRRPERFFAVFAQGAFPAEMHLAQKLQKGCGLLCQAESGGLDLPGCDAAHQGGWWQAPQKALLAPSSRLVSSPPSKTSSFSASSMWRSSTTMASLS